MVRDRNESGQYADGIDPETVLDVVDAREDLARPITAGDVVDELGIARRTAHNKLGALVERDVLETRKIGARGRVWWRPILADSGDTQPPRDGRESVETSPVSESLDETVDRIADESIRGSGSKHAARKEAFFAVVDYLREYGSATPDDLKREVYPNHRARHTDGDDPAHSWWKNSMYPPLRDLAEETSVVEKADQSGTWEWNANNE